MATVATLNRIKRDDDLANSPIGTLKEFGIPRPRRLPELSADDQFPRDITRLSDKDVRTLMSFWTAYYAYANYQLGKAIGRKLVYNRLLERRRAILFEKFKPEKKTSDWSQAIEGRIMMDKEVKHLTMELAKAESLEAALNPLVWDFKAYADVASRDITARVHENEMHGRESSRKKHRFD